MIKVQPLPDGGESGSSSYWLGQMSIASNQQQEAKRLRIRLDNVKKKVNEIIASLEEAKTFMERLSERLSHVCPYNGPIDGGSFDEYAKKIGETIESLKELPQECDERIKEVLQDYKTAIANYSIAEANYEAALAREASGSVNNDNNNNNNNSTRYNKKSCFLKGTKVALEKGLVDIDKVKINDVVYTYNENIKKKELKKVTKIFVHYNIKEKLYKLVFDNYSLYVTASHRFYVNSIWKSAEELKVGEELIYIDGTKHKIDSITYNYKKDTYYNIEVEDNHNYFVSEKGVLVHNKKAFVNDISYLQ